MYYDALFKELPTSRVTVGQGYWGHGIAPSIKISAEGHVPPSPLFKPTLMIIDLRVNNNKRC